MGVWEKIDNWFFTPSQPRRSYQGDLCGGKRGGGGWVLHERSVLFSCNAKNPTHSRVVLAGFRIKDA